MDPDSKLEKQFESFQEVAKENKNVDLAALMINSLQNTNKNLVPSGAKKWAYLISIGLPPFGVLFAAKYYFSDEEDAKHVANICIALTVISLLAFWLLGKVFLSGSGTSLDQIQKINVQDIQQIN